MTATPFWKCFPFCCSQDYDQISFIIYLSGPNGIPIWDADLESYLIWDARFKSYLNSHYSVNFYHFLLWNQLYYVLIAHEFVHTWNYNTCHFIVIIFHCEPLKVKNMFFFNFGSIVFSLAHSRNSLNICWINICNPFTLPLLTNTRAYDYLRRNAYINVSLVFIQLNIFSRMCWLPSVLLFSVTWTPYQPDTVLGTVDITEQHL